MRTKYFSNNFHIDNLVSSAYYRNLVLLRNTVETACDDYFQKLNAPKVDLSLITKAVSSPLGRGSDSLPISFRFGDKKAYLGDSAQFGMEPLVLNSFEMAYCYLPSFRGENSDSSHLNQFYHCEAELRGGYKKCMNIVQDLVKNVISEVIASSKKKLIYFDAHNFFEIESLLDKNFPVITFDEVHTLLKKNNLSHLIKSRPYGRVLTREGEIKVAELVDKDKIPVWVIKYDRDTVPFYQKPDPENPEKVLNADLIFPSLNGGFGGEIIGSGQRQDSSKEILQSMKRQEIKNIKYYKWYIELRNNLNYKTTSGFGLGIERFVAWMLGLNSIIDAAVYPVVKNERSKY